MAAIHPQLKPYKPTDENPFDSVKAAHLLQRAGFGGTPEEIRRVVEMGPAAAVDWLMDFPDAGAEEQSQTDVPDLSSLDGYPKNFREIAEKMRGMTADEKMTYRQKLQQANRQAVGQTASWWIDRMKSGPYALQEKLTLFWHGHFTTSAKDERAASLIWNQNELLRRMSVGNFREYVRQISRDPAMLDYLNNSQNRKQHPNENYARELMELFTLGIGNYTEDDIKQAARAFTGWAHDGDDFIFRKMYHDEEEKAFFGKTGNFNGDDIIELILQNPACAKYISSKLFKFFAYEEIESQLADSMAGILRESKWEMRPLLRTILNSQAFYSPKAIGSQIKSPIQLVVGTVRLLDLEMPDERPMRRALQQMGQIPLEPPNVKGWPGGRMWINTSTLFVRYNTAVSLVNPGAESGGRRERKRTSGSTKLAAMTQSSQPEAIVDEWLTRMIQRPVDAEKKKVLVEALDDPPNSEQGLRRMVALIVSMPEYQLC